MKFGGHPINSQRTKTWFAIFPVTIGGETRWLERVTVLQEWYMTDITLKWYSWSNIRFINK